MNRQLTAKYLQYLRRENRMTQETLAERLHVSRQAVSKWETGQAVPDLDSLLLLSNLYGKTINELLEPVMEQGGIQDFEEITGLAEKSLREILSECGTQELVLASMGASPEAGRLLQKAFPEIDFRKEQNRIGTVRVSEIEAAQSRIVAWINLS